MDDLERIMELAGKIGVNTKKTTKTTSSNRNDSPDGPAPKMTTPTDVGSPTGDMSHPARLPQTAVDKAIDKSKELPADDMGVSSDIGNLGTSYGARTADDEGPVGVNPNWAKEFDDVGPHHAPYEVHKALEKSGYGGLDGLDKFMQDHGPKTVKDPWDAFKRDEENDRVRMDHEDLVNRLSQKYDQEARDMLDRYQTKTSGFSNVFTPGTSAPMPKQVMNVPDAAPAPFSPDGPAPKMKDPYTWGPDGPAPKMVNPPSMGPGFHAGTEPGPYDRVANEHLERILRSAGLVSEDTPPAKPKSAMQNRIEKARQDREAAANNTATDDVAKLAAQMDQQEQPDRDTSPADSTAIDKAIAQAKDIDARDVPEPAVPYIPPYPTSLGTSGTRYADPGKDIPSKPIFNPALSLGPDKGKFTLDGPRGTGDQGESWNEPAAPPAPPPAAPPAPPPAEPSAASPTKPPETTDPKVLPGQGGPGSSENNPITVTARPQGVDFSGWDSPYKRFPPGYQAGGSPWAMYPRSEPVAPVAPAPAPAPAPQGNLPTFARGPLPYSEPKPFAGDKAPAAAPKSAPKSTPKAKAADDDNQVYYRDPGDGGPIVKLGTRKEAGAGLYGDEKGRFDKMPGDNTRFFKAPKEESMREGEVDPRTLPGQGGLGSENDPIVVTPRNVSPLGSPWSGGKAADWNTGTRDTTYDVLPPAARSAPVYVSPPAARPAPVYVSPPAAASQPRQGGGGPSISASEYSKRLTSDYPALSYYLTPDMLKRYAASVGVRASGDTIGGDRRYTADEISRAIGVRYGYNVPPGTVRSYANKYSVPIDESMIIMIEGFMHHSMNESALGRLRQLSGLTEADAVDSAISAAPSLNIPKQSTTSDAGEKPAPAPTPAPAPAAPAAPPPASGGGQFKDTVGRPTDPKGVTQDTVGRSTDPKGTYSQAPGSFPSGTPKPPSFTQPPPAAGTATTPPKLGVDPNVQSGFLPNYTKSDTSSPDGPAPRMTTPPAAGVTSSPDGPAPRMTTPPAAGVPPAAPGTPKPPTFTQPIPSAPNPAAPPAAPGAPKPPAFTQAPPAPSSTIGGAGTSAPSAPAAPPAPAPGAPKPPAFTQAPPAPSGTIGSATPPGAVKPPTFTQPPPEAPTGIGPKPAAPATPAAPPAAPATPAAPPAKFQGTIKDFQAQNPGATVGQALNAIQGKTARQGGANDPSVIQGNIDKQQGSNPGAGPKAYNPGTPLAPAAPAAPKPAAPKAPAAADNTQYYRDPGNGAPIVPLGNKQQAGKGIYGNEQGTGVPGDNTKFFGVPGDGSQPKGPAIGGPAPTPGTKPMKEDSDLSWMLDKLKKMSR